MDDETSCQYISSRGIVKSCERRNRIIQSSTRNIDPDLFDNLEKDDTVIHICSFLTISTFATHIAPKLTKRIILVTNDSDFDSPIFEKPVGKGDEINKEAILQFLNSDKCAHWFTQNCTLQHPKVTPIPIGMDYHTFHQAYGIPPRTQEQSILSIAQNPTTKPFHKRILKCYCNFKFTMVGKYYTDDRLQCLQQVPNELMYQEETYLPIREDTWKRQKLFAFVLSPAGGGYDCHRTWEALLLGCIPIVKRFHIPHENVYANLPILIVNEWSDITENLLQQTVDLFQQQYNTFQWEKLTLAYWKQLIYSYKINPCQTETMETQKTSCATRADAISTTHL